MKVHLGNQVLAKKMWGRSIIFTTIIKFKFLSAVIQNQSNDSNTQLYEKVGLQING